MSVKERYNAGLDILGGDGVSAGDFVPWLSTISKAFGGGSSGGGSDDAVRKALAQKQAEEQARRTQALLYIVLGVLGLGALGGGAYLIMRKPTGS